MVEVKEYIETVTKMLYCECRRRNLYADEDLVQECLMRSLEAMKELYDERRGVKWTTYIWRVIDSLLKDELLRRSKELNNVSLEEMRESNSDGEVRDWYLRDDTRVSFSSRLLNLLSKYQRLVGEDFLRLMIGDTDISNALRSLSISKKGGEEWIEWWLGRALSEVERKCCQEIRELLQEVQGKICIIDIRSWG